jgi:hypothetical protein
VGDANNRSVTITATPTPATCILYWTVTKGTIPAGYKGGPGPAVLVFGAGSLEPGAYNVACHAVNPTDNTFGNATSTFTIPALPLHLVPGAPGP